MESDSATNESLSSTSAGQETNPTPTVVTNPQPLAATTTQGTELAASTLLITFGVGRSYLFYADRKGSRKPKERWRDLFPGDQAWSFEQFDEYQKPLGESVAFTFNDETHVSACKTIKRLKQACENNLLADLDENHIRIYFFTAGVALVVVRLTPKHAGDTLAVVERIQEKDHRKTVRECVNDIGKLCTTEYFNVLDRAESDKRSFRTKGWSLRRIREAEREDSKLSRPNFYPLFYLPVNSYNERTASILDQVSSALRREQQSEAAKVPYEGAEVYVDWSEALITKVGTDREAAEKNRTEIENNFIIALACWQTLVLMDQNSAVFLLDTFADMVANKPRSNATAVHEKNMAYKGVSDAWLPIRWTTKRRDLFLLETIHRNWSSERWRDNIEERMKLVDRHYNRLEDDQKESAERRLATAAAVLALFTLSSAIADIINLVNDKKVGLLGYPLQDIDIFLSGIPALIAVVFGIGLGARTPKVRRAVRAVTGRVVRFWRDSGATQTKSLTEVRGLGPANRTTPEVPVLQEDRPSIPNK